MSAPVDVLAVLDFHIGNMTAPRQQPQVDELREVRAAVADLSAAAADVVERGTDSPVHNRLLAALARIGGDA